jgi:hypothetical protein
MNPISPAIRGLLWIAALGSAIGLLINTIDWWHGTLVFAGPRLVDQTGMLIVIASLLLPHSLPVLRVRLAIVALILIVPSTLLIIWRAL